MRDRLRRGHQRPALPARSSSWPSPGSAVSATGPRSPPTGSPATARASSAPSRGRSSGASPPSCSAARSTRRRLGVISAFLDRDDAARAAAQAAAEEACAAEGLELLAWRDVPTDDTQLGEHARSDRPALVHGLMLHPEGIDAAEAERRAFRARRRAAARAADEQVRHYFASWSFATVTYKALVISDRLARFYPDLADDDFAASHLVFHSRFSTNTLPAWERAQPFRHLCHNGEINTLQGNEYRMLARGQPRLRGGRARPRSAAAPGPGPVRLRLREARRDPRAAGARRARPAPRRSRCWCPRRGRAAVTSTPRSATSSATTRA